jgi:hypothetical protein
MNENCEGQYPQEALNAATLADVDRPRFSICTIVNRPAQYAELVKSFQAGGFTTGAGCEYLYLDNSSGNKYEAYSGYNIFLRFSRGKYLILCHQDVSLIEDGFDRLNEVIEELDAHDPNWGLFGNSGVHWPGRQVIRISDHLGKNQLIGGPFPQRCYSLDENFIVVRADANLALSSDLAGFHLYATELCLVAAELGHQSYVVDFHLHHAGEAIMDKAYSQIRSAMIRKYSRMTGMRLVRTPCSDLIFAPWVPLTWLADKSTGRKISRLVSRIFGSPPAPNEKISS